jgi:hypothetical protein
MEDGNVKAPKSEPWSGRDNDKDSSKLDGNKEEGNPRKGRDKAERPAKRAKLEKVYSLT